MKKTRRKPALWTCEETIGKAIYNKEILDILVPVVHIKTYEEDTPKAGVREDSGERKDPKAEDNVGGQ